MAQKDKPGQPGQTDDKHLGIQTDAETKIAGNGDRGASILGNGDRGIIEGGADGGDILGNGDRG